MGQIANWLENSGDLNKIISNVSSYIPNSDYVSSKGLDCLIDETDPHFGTNGQLKLGKRYADIIIILLN